MFSTAMPVGGGAHGGGGGGGQQGHTRELLEDGLSSLIGGKVVFGAAPAGQAGADFGPFASIVHRPPDIASRIAPPPGQRVTLHASTLDGSLTCSVEVHTTDKISKLRAEIAKACAGRVEKAQQIVVIADSRRCEDSETVGACQLGPGGTVHVVIKSHNDGEAGYVVFFPESFLEPGKNYLFNDHDTKAYERGGKTYLRPVGSQRYALKVTKMFDGGNDTWLGVDANAWPVSYHGTNPSFIELAARELAAAPGVGAAALHGHPTTPNPDLAWQHSRSFRARDGETYQIILQHRVHPGHIREVQGRNGSQFWLVDRQQDIRPYGICIRKDPNPHDATRALESVQLANPTGLLRMSTLGIRSDGDDDGSGGGGAAAAAAGPSPLPVLPSFASPLRPSGPPASAPVLPSSLSSSSPAAAAAAAPIPAPRPPSSFSSSSSSRSSLTSSAPPPAPSPSRPAPPPSSNPSGKTFYLSGPKGGP